ncbi:hypothetical protein EKH57_14825 [Halorubrum sp. BOL3-1]|uniref:DUF5796 family protein n=1 Tax=Halorubrum sp. BOL3-1 TaxID=2497325 RepID=UPI0010050647|nr:DUF5796 family protein [Halorubrum sp. BOL3-1]QAU13890.1 hypothetical protein EKH57_14825 [Halorubrum sp. BOL3-1]
MSAPSRSDVPPTSIGVDLREEGIVVEYLDGRTTLYRGVPESTEGSVTAGPGKETHVLVTDPTETEGVMTYVNDYKTDDEILEDSGVGRVIVDDGERDEVFPGVIVGREGQRNEVVADPETAGGRVFVFVEDGWTEGSYEIVEGPDDGLDAHR